MLGDYLVWGMKKETEYLGFSKHEVRNRCQAVYRDR